MKSPRRRYLLIPALAVLAVLALAGPSLAQSPSVGAATPVPQATQTPASSESLGPCPNPTAAPSHSLAPGQTPAPTRRPNLCPATPEGTNPLSILAWAFTPIFQAIFLTLVLFYSLVHDIGIAIVVVTLIIRLLLFPVFRSQIVSQRRMQMVQPELRAISTKYKGDRAKIQEEQMRLYQERGVNPLAGCVPTIVTMFLLFPMYSVFSSGVSAPDISSMLKVFGVQVLNVACQPLASTGTVPCLDPIVHWLPNPATGGLLDASRPEILFTVVGFGFSLLALISALLQLVQTRMMTPSTSDPQAQSMQRTMLLLPFLSLIYGSFLPAGLFLYWIVTTIFSIVQQYWIAGWGSLFPLFGWTPGFAAGHTPRYPMPPPPPPRKRPEPPSGGGPGRQAPSSIRSARDNAAGTVRPNKERARTSRRGRRR